MRNPNAPASRLKKALIDRWSAEDYPGAQPRFQILLLAKDIAVFFLLPVLAISLFKACESDGQPKSRSSSARARSDRIVDSSRSQIIHFVADTSSSGSPSYSAPRRSPGALVKVRLLNVIETYSTAPVHAQIADGSLGDGLKGGTLIGDATPEPNFERISISFRLARDPNRQGVAIPISARALSLDGTLGLDAVKKEGFIARSAIGSAALGSQNLHEGASGTDLQSLLLKALTAGLFQEMGTSSQVARNRAQVLTLRPPTEFYAELTDFFPGGAR